MNKEYNIIFLDIDGVLNGYNKWNLLGWKILSKINYKPLELWYKCITNPFGIHESKVKRLTKIVKATNAKIVLSSTWRINQQSENYKLLISMFNKYNIEIIDITPISKNKHRGIEISKWLDINRSIVKNFIILDDEISDMNPFINSPRLIQTIDDSKHRYKGLNGKHVKESIKMLRL